MTMQYKVRNNRLKRAFEMDCPKEIWGSSTPSRSALRTVTLSRQTVSNILSGKDPRFLLIVGPCSIHDEHAALEYAKQLAKLQKRVEKDILLVMRVYFEKPRTTVGWKGLISDPHLNGSCDVNAGLRAAYKLLVQITGMKMPCASEFVDTIMPQYYGHLITVGAIGARTVESQPHRMMGSGLSSAVGFKNTTDGNVMRAVQAIETAQKPGQFIGIDEESGAPCYFTTTGNKDSFLILRGGTQGPNYGTEHVRSAMELLDAAHIKTGIVVDCSHANASGDYLNQLAVLHDIAEQRRAGNQRIVGAMLESFIVPGKQSLDARHQVYGQSVTDACLGWGQTEASILELREQLQS